MKKNLLIIFLSLCLFLLGNIKIDALEITENRGISDFCVHDKINESNFDILVFRVNQDMDFDSKWDYIEVTIDDKVYTTHDNFDRFEHLESGIEVCGGAGSRGPLSRQITKGTPIIFRVKAADASKLSITLGYTSDNIKYSEKTTYDLIERKIEKIELYNDNYAGRMNDGISKKYNNYIIPMMGDFSGFTFAYDPDKGENEYKNAIEIGFVSYSDFNRTLESVIYDVDKLLEKNNIKLPNEANNINSDFLEEIKSLNQSYTYESKLGDTINYSWTFDGSKIINTNLLVDLSLNIGESTNKEKIESLVSNKEKSLVLEFKHHGALPEGTKIKVNVLDKFKNGVNLSLYYFNDNGSLEEVIKTLKVEDGFVEFNIDHCSEYVLVENTNNAKTGALDVTFYSILLIGSLLGIILILNCNTLNHNHKKLLDA